MKTFKVLYFGFPPIFFSRHESHFSKRLSTPRRRLWFFNLHLYLFIIIYFYNWYNPRLEQTTPYTLLRADKGDDFGQA